MLETKAWNSEALNQDLMAADDEVWVPGKLSQRVLLVHLLLAVDAALWG